MAAGRSWLRLALRRMADEPGLLGAAFLVALVAATVAAACVIYPDMMSRRGLLEVLEGADPAAAVVVVAADVEAAAAEDADAASIAALDDALGPGAGAVVRTARSGSWQLPGGEGLAYPPLTAFAWDDGLEARTTLVAGALPRDRSPDRPEVAVTRGAAEALGVRAGDVLEVTSRADPGRRLRAVVSGVVEVADPLDPAWGGDRLALDGTAQPGSFPQRGPLYVTRATLLALAGEDDVTLTWRALPAFGRLEPDDLAAVRGGVAGLEARLERDLGSDARPSVSSGLVDVLEEAGAGVVAGRGGIAIIALQLLVLAAYALVLLASLVQEQRRTATELAAARGAAGSTVVGLAALEGIIVALPAVVLGPLLAVAVVGIVGGPGAGTIAAPGPRLTGDAIALALTTGLVIVGSLALPAAAAAGPVTRLRGRLTRRGPRSLAERSGVDLALLVLAVLGLWQLRESGSPLAQVEGLEAGVDPLLAIAPAIGLLAGGLLALRIGPLVGSWLERPARAASGAVAALAGRGVARRSPEAGRAALLVVVATGFVLFTAAYARTWTQAQADQVAAAVPAELVAAAAAGPAAPAGWVVRDELRALPGVGDAVPATRETFTVGTALPRGVLLAVPAEAAGRSVQAGRDTEGRHLAELTASLAAGRPAVPVLELPAGATALELQVDADLVAAAGEDGTVRPIPDGWAGLSPAVVVRDGSGLLHRLAGPPGRVAGGGQVLEVPLTTSGDGGRAARLEEPVSVVGIELELALPDGVAATGAVRLAGVTARAAGGASGAVDLGPARSGWTPVRSTFGVAPTPIPVDPAAPLTARLEELVVGPVPVVVGLRAAAAAEGAGDGALPAIVDAATAAAVGLAAGDVVPVARGASEVALVRVAHVVDLLPGVAPGAGGILVDLPTLALRDYIGQGTVNAATEWWVEPEAGADLAAAAEGAAALGLGDVRVRAALLEERRADPLARGVLGALGLAAAAALAIAAVGFGVAAWRSVRSRRLELAVVRALGLPHGQSTAWLALELAFQLALGIGGGIALGIALAWAVLPSVTVTPDGSTPIPPPVVVMPWDLVLAALGIGLAVYVVLLVPLRGRGPGSDLAGALREAQP